MPYIKPHLRDALEKGEFSPCDAGELNFCITIMLKDYLKLRDIPKYTTFNEVMGVLECVKQEFYRRVIVPHESRMIKENTDVY